MRRAHDDKGADPLSCVESEPTIDHAADRKADDRGSLDAEGVQEFDDLPREEREVGDPRTGCAFAVAVEVVGHNLVASAVLGDVGIPEPAREPESVDQNDGRTSRRIAMDLVGRPARRVVDAGHRWSLRHQRDCRGRDPSLRGPGSDRRCGGAGVHRPRRRAPR